MNYVLIHSLVWLLRRWRDLTCLSGLCISHSKLLCLRRRHQLFTLQLQQAHQLSLLLGWGKSNSGAPRESKTPWRNSCNPRETLQLTLVYWAGTNFTKLHTSRFRGPSRTTPLKTTVTGHQKKALARFGEFCSCCCLPLLPQLAWSIHETWPKPFSGALYNRAQRRRKRSRSPRRGEIDWNLNNNVMARSYGRSRPFLEKVF